MKLVWKNAVGGVVDEEVVRENMSAAETLADLIKWKWKDFGRRQGDEIECKTI